MQILLWLVPPFFAAVIAMIWVAWVSREGRGEVHPDEAMRLLGNALEKEPTYAERHLPPPRERSTGVAVRKNAS